MADSALSRLCRNCLGFDPAQLSEEELRAKLPVIVQAVHAETVSTLRAVHWQREEIQKSARIQALAIASYIPNGTPIRDERVPDWDSVSESDLNSVFDSLLPE